MTLAGTHIASAILVSVLTSCGDNNPPESWVPFEDDVLEDVNVGLIWQGGDDDWMIAEPLDDPHTFAVVHFDGDRWEYVAEGQWPDGQTRARWPSAPNDLWVVIGTHLSSQEPEYDLWRGDGSSWSLVDAFTGLSAPATIITSVWGTAADDVWVTAELADGDDVALRYDGETWQVMFQRAVAAEYGGRLLLGCSYDRDDVVLWGGTPDLPESINMPFMFRWDGAGWNEVSYGDVSLLCPQGGGAWGINGTYADAVHPLPRDLVHNDGDGGWEPLMLFDQPTAISDVWIDDEGDGWILGYEIPSDADESPRAEIWRLSERVVTPTLVNGPVLDNGVLRSIWQTASGRVFAFGAGRLVLEYVGPE